MTAVEKMERAIEEKRMTTGAMGTEATSVTIKATKEEVDEIIEAIEDNDHYNWEIEEDGITVTYTEGEDMKYFVIDEAGVDIYSDEFDTLEEANQAAQNEWEGLTDHDKIRGENHQRRIYVLRAKDEETLWDDNYSDETYFDSAK